MNYRTWRLAVAAVGLVAWIGVASAQSVPDRVLVNGKVAMTAHLPCSPRILRGAFASPTQADENLGEPSGYQWFV